jgi:hypothetical protein
MTGRDLDSKVDGILAGMSVDASPGNGLDFGRKVDKMWKGILGGERKEYGNEMEKG